MILQASIKVGIYYYFFPHFSQGRKILWDGVNKDGFKFLNYIPKDLIDGDPNSTEMKIRLKNGSIIQIIGTNNIDSIVGTNPCGCVFSEYPLQDPKAWQLIRPILVENGGWAIFNFTPRGKNFAYDMYQMAERNSEWFCQLLTVLDTQIVSEKDIQAERDAGMPEDFIQQEFYCSFTLGVEGAYYAKYLQEARDEDRIGSVPWQKQSKVFTAWDIGFGDATSIIFYQIIGGSVHIIDFYENQGEGLPHYAGILSSKPYLYGDHFAPHDIDAHHISTGLSTKEVGSSLGVNFTTLPTLRLRIEDGIEALRGVFPRLYIDEVRCKHLIKCLENYRKKFDERMSVYQERPLHDWTSHASDCARYMALAVKLYVDNRGDVVTDRQADAWYNQYKPIFNN